MKEKFGNLHVGVNVQPTGKWFHVKLTKTHSRILSDAQTWPEGKKHHSFVYHCNLFIKRARNMGCTELLSKTHISRFISAFSKESIIRDPHVCWQISDDPIMRIQSWNMMMMMMINDLCLNMMMINFPVFFCWSIPQILTTTTVELMRRHLRKSFRMEWWPQTGRPGR